MTTEVSIGLLQILLFGVLNITVSAYFAHRVICNFLVSARTRVHDFIDGNIEFARFQHKYVAILEGRINEMEKMVILQNKVIAELIDNYGKQGQERGDGED
jgi:hypothetical protein